MPDSVAVGHINEQTVGLITLVGLITIGLSTYLILYSHQIYEVLAPVLSIFQRKNPYREADQIMNERAEYDVIIIGLGRFGKRLAEMLDDHPTINYFGVDFDPSVVKSRQEIGKDIVYGDIEDPELLDNIPFREAKCIVSTVKDAESSKQLVKSLHREGYKGKIFLTAINESDYEFLKGLGADQVLLPHQMAATNFYNSFLLNLLRERNSISGEEKFATANADKT